MLGKKATDKHEIEGELREVRSQRPKSAGDLLRSPASKSESKIRTGHSVKDLKKMKAYEAEALRIKAGKTYKILIKNGVGMRVFASGGVYRGELTDGAMHGRGVLTYSNGDVRICLLMSFTCLEVARYTNLF